MPLFGLLIYSPAIAPAVINNEILAAICQIRLFDHPFLFNPLGDLRDFFVGELPDGQATIWCKNIPRKVKPPE